jgi:hypothetical protein
MDVGSAETRYHLEPVDDWTVDRVFEHQWAVSVLETVFDRLRRQYEAEGKAVLFDQAKGSLTQAGGSIPYADLAACLHMTEGAVRAAVHSLRSRYRELLREEIGHTVADPAEVKDEIRHLFQALANR